MRVQGKMGGPALESTMSLGKNVGNLWICVEIISYKFDLGKKVSRLELLTAFMSGKGPIKS